jgi:ketosteroid isomerase-like protein
MEPELAHAALEETIQAWATAWSEQNVDGYLAFYSVHFDPEGSVNRADWEAVRRSRILRPSWIRLTVGPITASAIEEDRVSATFLQTYATETYSDQVKKTLILAREQGGWKIVHERSE